MCVTAILASAAMGAVGSIAAGSMQANAAEKASETQAEAADKSLALQEKIYETNRNDSMPWLEAGRTALDALQGELGLKTTNSDGTPFKSGFQETPGYAFQQEEGQKAVRNSQAALGMKASGASLKKLATYSQGLADSTYQNYLTRISNIATGGQQQVNSNASTGANYAANAGTTIQDAGAARASGYVGSANAWSNSLSNIYNMSGNALGWAYGGKNGKGSGSGSGSGSGNNDWWKW